MLSVHNDSDRNSMQVSGLKIDKIWLSQWNSDAKKFLQFDVMHQKLCGVD